jgi:DDB1- and CUL4-associated factor 13
MKVKTISRRQDFQRERVGDIFKVERNNDPTLHPFEKAREYTRALNATKLDRLFAKPFVAALSGHIDGVYTMSTHPTKLNTLFSGSADGEIRMWDLGTHKTTWEARAHKGFVRGVCAVPFSDAFVSAGEDSLIKLWNGTSTTVFPTNTACCFVPVKKCIDTRPSSPLKEDVCNFRLGN